MRRRLLFVAIGLLAVTSTTLAEPLQRGHDVRWDLVQVVQNIVLVGGTNGGQDSASLDTITLTGSGDAEPAEGNAAGGGTFVHRHANGTLVARGAYVVTGFISWQPAGGSLKATGLTDGIGHESEASAGILTLAVRLFPARGAAQEGVLDVNCDLPGATFAIEEGIALAVDGFHFQQHGGFTVFHVQK
jgi:hypothetical protein